FGYLAGRSAPHDFLQLVIYKAATFSEEIQQIDTVRAYHSGPNYFVEVDIVMPGDTPLWKAHDLSQQMQDKLETLPGVERAFVHVDHETTHRPEHRKYS
ncbi:Photosystem II protein D1, partial [Tulasnella sp. 427]